MISKLLELYKGLRGAAVDVALLVDRPRSDTRGQHLMSNDVHYHIFDARDIEDSLRDWIKGQYIPSATASFRIQLKSGANFSLHDVTGIEVQWRNS